MRAASVIVVLVSVLLTAAPAAAQDDGAVVVPGRLFPVTGAFIGVKALAAVVAHNYRVLRRR